MIWYDNFRKPAKKYKAHAPGLRVEFMMDKVFMPAKLSGVMAAPASKSEAHRRMICAGLTMGETRLDGFMASSDMAATIRCLKGLGTQVEESGDVLIIRGGKPKAGKLPVLDCGESGSTLRFFVPIALSVAGGATFRMHGLLGQRPMEVYRDLFVPRGVTWRMGVGADCAAELTVTGRMEAGQYVLPGNVSSQFVSGLLFALPLLKGESTLTVLPPVESVGYINMTIEALKQSGIVVKEDAPFSWTIPGEQSYKAASGRISGDYSQAAVMLCAGAMGHDTAVSGLETVTTQGDQAVLRHLKALGAGIACENGTITVKGGQLQGAVLDMRDCPDIAPVLALTCQLAKGESRLAGCGRLRLKECDRLAATVKILNQLGGDAKAQGDDMLIRGVEQLEGGVEIDGCNDHRMVMLAALAAAGCRKPVTVKGVEALNKSWPEFLNVYESLGGIVK